MRLRCEVLRSSRRISWEQYLGILVPGIWISQPGLRDFDLACPVLVPPVQYSIFNNFLCMEEKGKDATYGVLSYCTGTYQYVLVQYYRGRRSSIPGLKPRSNIQLQCPQVVTAFIQPVACQHLSPRASVPSAFEYEST